jgi:hypothetical protein
MKAPVFQRITEEDVAELGDPGRKILQTLGELPDQFARALGRGLTLRENLRCQLHEVEFMVPAATVTLGAGFTGSATLARGADGSIALSGTITPAATALTTVPVATLPPGFRPGSALTFGLDEIAQEPWSLVTTFANGWINDNSGGYDASFMRDASGWTHMRGGVQAGALSAVALTVPIGYRPPSGQNRFMLQAGGPATDYGILTLLGDLVLFGASTVYVDLSPVYFQASGPTQLTIGTDGVVSVVNPTRGTFSLAGISFQSAPNTPPEPWASGVHFASTLPKIATHVLAAGLRNVTDKVDVTSFTNPGWRNSTIDSRAHIQILDWPGLPEGKTYRGFLIAFAEDAPHGT